MCLSYWEFNRYFTSVLSLCCLSPSGQLNVPSCHRELVGRYRHREVEYSPTPLVDARLTCLETLPASALNEAPSLLPISGRGAPVTSAGGSSKVRPHVLFFMGSLLHFCRNRLGTDVFGLRTPVFRTNRSLWSLPGSRSRALRRPG